MARITTGTTYLDRIEEMIASTRASNARDPADAIRSLLVQRRRAAITHSAKLLEQAHNMLLDLGSTDPEARGIRQQVGECLIALHSLD